MQSLHSLVREAENHLVSDKSSLGKYVEHDHLEIIENIIAYLNSKHTSGDKDSLGREKPFFNIVNAAVNIWYRATDIDRKDIRFVPERRSSVILSFVANDILRKWMDKNEFGRFLNKWGRTLAQYGSAVVKFVEKGDKLVSEVIPWNRLIVDPVDFDALPRIEKLYFTPSQLRNKKEYNQEAVTELLSSLQERENLDGTTNDLRNDFIEVYEIHGELPVAHLMDEPEDEDWEKYTQQMHVISYVETKDEGEYQDFSLFSGREEKDPYMITHLIEEEGRTLSLGAVELLLDTQWMQNHTAKNVKDTLDLASKLIFQTADSKFIGRNALRAIENGDILIHKENQPLTQINNSKADITAFQNFGKEWRALAQEITSTPDALRGTTMPSGTPFALGSLLGAQAGSLFEIMTENKGLHLEEMLRRFVIPHIQKSLDNKDEIMAILDDAGVQEIDAAYIPSRAIRNYNQRTKDQILNGEAPDVFNRELEEHAVKDQFATQGNRRPFVPDELGKKTWAEVFSKFQWENVRVEVTNENVDKREVLTTLASLFQTIGSNPAILQDPNAKLLFSEILTETGKLSPLQLASATPSSQTGGSTGGALQEIAKQTDGSKQTAGAS